MRDTGADSAGDAESGNYGGDPDCGNSSGCECSGCECYAECRSYSSAPAPVCATSHHQ